MSQGHVKIHDEQSEEVRSQDKDKPNLLRVATKEEADSLMNGKVIQMGERIFKVKKCRQLLEAFGEPDGYCLELEEILQ